MEPSAQCLQSESFRIGMGLQGVEKPRKGLEGKAMEFLENRMATNREGSHEAE